MENESLSDQNASMSKIDSAADHLIVPSSPNLDANRMEIDSYSEVVYIQDANLHETVQEAIVDETLSSKKVALQEPLKLCNKPALNVWPSSFKIPSEKFPLSLNTVLSNKEPLGKKNLMDLLNILYEEIVKYTL